MSDILISTSDIIPMDIFFGVEPIKIDLVYADKNHSENIFKTALYKPDARLSLYRDFARVVILTARILNQSHHWTLVLKDGLRTIDAQSKMMETDIVKLNPQWLVEPRMLSSPGQGGHPRGMAVDVCARDEDNNDIDMGTLFDTMTPESARDYNGFNAQILENRKILEQSFVAAARHLNLPLLPLPSEWWDFRFPASYSNQFMPISDDALPKPLQMTRNDGALTGINDDDLAKSILMSL